MVALPPLKSTTSQDLDLAKEEQTKRLLCEGGEVGTKGSHIDRQTLRLSEGRDSRASPSIHDAKTAFGREYSGQLRSPQKLKMFWGPHLWEGYAERSRVSKPSSCPPIEIGKRG